MTAQPDFASHFGKSFLSVIAGTLVAKLGFLILLFVVIAVAYPEYRDQLAAVPQAGEKADVPAAFPKSTDLPETSGTQEKNGNFGQANNNSKQENPKKTSQKQPDDENKLAPGQIPPPPYSFCWVSVILSVVTAFLGGYITGWLAPIARRGHGFILAMIVGVTSFQMILAEDSPLPKWTIALIAIGSPLLTYWGTVVCDQRMGPIAVPDNQDDDEMESEMDEPDFEEGD